MALNINGTTGISGVDGSASAPAVAGTDSNTGINFGSDTVNINTGGTTKASISSVGKLTLTSTETANSNPVVLNASGQAYYQVITPNNTIGGIKFGDTDDDDVAAIKYGHGDNSMRFDVNTSERMRIDSNGRVKINATSYVSTAVAEQFASDAGTSGGYGGVFASNTAGGYASLYCKTGSNVGTFIYFYRDSSQIGTITTDGSSTAYNTSSDYRLKENAVLISDGITRLKTLKPYRFNWKVDPSTTVDGFFAHEVTAVPEAVTGTKDEISTDEDGAVPKGEPIYQSIDQSKLVPLLTAALQEAVAKIEVLETKVAALEAG